MGRRLLGAWLALAALGCDYDNDGPAVDASAPADDGAVTAPPALDGGSTLLDAQTDGAGSHDGAPSHDASMPEHESFGTALALQTDDAVLQDITHTEQTNYFVFDTSAPGFYELRTSNNDFSPDVVISLYDDSQTMIAQNDNGSLWPGDAVDARLVVHLARAGRWYLKVYDPSTPEDYFSSGAFLVRYYRLDLHALTPGSDGVVFRQDGQDTPITFAKDEASGYGFTTVLGTMEPATLDTFSIAGTPTEALIGHVLAAGALGNGSTASTTSVSVVRDADARVIGEADGSADHQQLFPPLDQGAYTLTVSAPGELGSHAFYAVDLVTLPDNPREQHEADNGTTAGAEAIAFVGAGQRRGLILADVPGGDVDYFEIDAAAGATVYASCQGQSAGSGVRALHGELRDAHDTTLVAANESASHDLDIGSFSTPSVGKFYLRLWSDAAGSTDVEPWVRCVVIASP